MQVERVGLGVEHAVRNPTGENARPRKIGVSRIQVAVDVYTGCRQHVGQRRRGGFGGLCGLCSVVRMRPAGTQGQKTQDRKSTRLNSSHRCISYAVFCLKKKKNKIV